MSEQNIELETAETGPPPSYRIDQAWYDRNRRSLDDMIEARVAEMNSGDKPKAKRRRKSEAPSMAELSKIEGFVNPRLPVREAAFRLLLLHENKPMDVEQLSQELVEHGVGILDDRLIRPNTLTRILDNDHYYGITRLDS